MKRQLSKLTALALTLSMGLSMISMAAATGSATNKLEAAPGGKVTNGGYTIEMTDPGATGPLTEAEAGKLTAQKSGELLNDPDGVVKLTFDVDGTPVSINGTKPVNVVLVMDESGSMNMLSNDNGTGMPCMNPDHYYRFPVSALERYFKDGLSEADKAKFRTKYNPDGKQYFYVNPAVTLKNGTTPLYFQMSTWANYEAEVSDLFEQAKGKDGKAFWDAGDFDKYIDYINASATTNSIRLYDFRDKMYDYTKESGAAEGVAVKGNDSDEFRNMHEEHYKLVGGRFVRIDNPDKSESTYPKMEWKKGSKNGKEYLYADPSAEYTFHGDESTRTVCAWSPELDGECYDRMTVSKNAALAFADDIWEVPGSRVAYVGFTGSARAVGFAEKAGKAAVVDYIDDTDGYYGTFYLEALYETINLIKESKKTNTNPYHVIFLSDGEPTDTYAPDGIKYATKFSKEEYSDSSTRIHNARINDIKKMAEDLKDLDVTIHTVGFNVQVDKQDGLGAVGGTFYNCQSADDIGQVFTAIAENIVTVAYPTGTLTDKISGDFEVLFGDNYPITVTVNETTTAYTTEAAATGANVYSKDDASGEETVQVALNEVDSAQVTFYVKMKAAHLDGSHDGTYLTNADTPNETGAELTYGPLDPTTGEPGEEETISMSSPQVEVSNTINIPVKKVWDEGDKGKDKRPAEITIRLMQGEGDAKAPVDGKVITKSSEEDSWTDTFTGLPKFAADGNTPIVYSVEEDHIPAYTVTVNGSAQNGFTVTNTRIDPGSASWTLDVKKTLDGAPVGGFSFLMEDKDGNQLDRVTVADTGEASFKPFVYDSPEDLGEHSYYIFEDVTDVDFSAIGCGEGVTVLDAIDFDESVYNAVITVSEDADGVYYVSNVTVTKDGQPWNKDEPQTFANAINRGSLTVAKKSGGNAVDRDDEFSFRVMLLNSTYTGEYDGLTFVGGKSETFTLKTGQSRTIDGLPIGTHYKVEETDSKGYLSSMYEGSQSEGFIVAEPKEKENTVTFYNYKHNPGDGQAIFMGTKELKGGKLNDGQFSFALEENGNVIQVVENQNGTIIFKRIAYSTNKSTHNTYYGFNKVINAGTHNYYSLNPTNDIYKLDDVATNSIYTYEDVSTVNTHIYYAYERIVGMPPDVIYDGHVFRIKVDVRTTEDGDCIVSAPIYTRHANLSAAYDNVGGESVNSISFVNQQTYDLKVTKMISGNKASADDEFSIKVDLKDADIDGAYGEMTFIDGVAVVKLKGGQSATAYNLPYGTAYEVTELNSGNYDVSYTNKTGNLTADQEVVVTNTWNDEGGGGGGGGGTTVNVSVKKVWVLDNGGTKTDSVNVALYRDGKVHKTATLSETNGWSYTWEELSDSYDWSVDETDVPDGFTKSVSSSGNRFTITNDDEPTDVPDIPGPGPEGGDDGDDGTDLGDSDVPRDEMNLEDPDVPKTGDVNMLMWLAMAVLSGFGLLALLRKREES